MQRNICTNVLLLIIALALVIIAVRTYTAPRAVQAQSLSTAPYPYFFEPGTQMLRAPDGSKQLYGRVVIDMRTGKVWGFPTNTPDTYPTNPVDNKPQVSHPFYLGRFAFEDINQ
ncbi:MAG TPA: hypothetical protein VFA02_08110 [Pseudacidobacterium sp.]|nr:hypothetical protein [Pseudacidobacterium sp.]